MYVQVNMVLKTKYIKFGNQMHLKPQAGVGLVKND